MNFVLFSRRTLTAQHMIKSVVLRRTFRCSYREYSVVTTCLKRVTRTHFDPNCSLKHRQFMSYPALCYSSNLTDLVHDVRLQRHLDDVLNIYRETEEKLKHSKEKELQSLKQTLFHLNNLVQLKSELDKCHAELHELEQMISESEAQEDEDFLQTALIEKESFVKKIEQCKVDVLLSLIPESTFDDKDTVVEISAGVGGQEAMLFAKDLFELYCNYAAFKGWENEVMKYDTTELGGVRNAQISLSGQNVFKWMKFESGVHRVQRVPKTERSGRVHTSTATVVVLPQPNEIDIVLNMRDIEMVFKRSSGAGGQHVNRTDSCVRLKHIPTGITVECQMERCQHRNRAIAMKSLKARLYQLEFNQITTEYQQSRKSIVGTSARSDKVRTYNFPQDRITDHRLQQNFYNIELFFLGREKFDALLQNLQELEGVEAVTDILQKYD